MAIFSVLFFRKIFTYLFFSMNEFNFFGAKGTLKPVEKMIAEEAKRLREQEKRTAENAQRDKEIKKLEVELANMGQSNTNAIEFAERIINLYEKQSKEVQKLKTEVDRPRMLQEALRRYAERLNGEVTTDDVKVDASISNKPNNPILN
jgi:CHASE3 domain sensor protein